MKLEVDHYINGEWSYVKKEDASTAPALLYLCEIYSKSGAHVNHANFEEIRNFEPIHWVLVTKNNNWGVRVDLPCLEVVDIFK